MAIHTPEDQPKPTPGFGQRQDNAPPPPSEEGLSMTRSFLTGGGFYRSIPKSQGAEAVRSITDGLVNVYKNNLPPDVEVRVIPLTQEEFPGLKFSAVVVGMRHHTQPKSGVAFYTYILEMTNPEPLKPRTYNVGRATMEINKYPSDAMDGELIKRVIDKLTIEYGPEIKLSNVDGCVVPKTFDYKDETALYTLAYLANTALDTYLATTNPEFSDINYGQLIQSGTRVTFRIETPNTDIPNLIGLPVRNDISVYLETSLPGKAGTQSPHDSIHDVSGVHQALHTTAYIDLLWAGGSGNALPNSMMGGYSLQHNQFGGFGFRPGQNQKYMPELIITSITSDSPLTPGTVMTGIESALSVVDSGNFMYTFVQAAMPKGEIDPRDFGALNVEAQLFPDENGKFIPIDTKSVDFGPTQLAELISYLLLPNIKVAIDLPDCGPETWYMSVFEAAVQGDQEAKAAILDAGNHATNGALSELWTGGDIFENTGSIEKIHLGYYIDHNGQARDIRNIDYRWVMNHVGVTSLDFMTRWSNTWTCTNVPIIERLEIRRSMILEMLAGREVHFTGLATRATFSTETLMIWANACRQAGMTGYIIKPMTGGDMMARRGVIGVDSGLAPSSLIHQAGPGINASPLSWGGRNPRWRGR